jgi:molybdopterin/thiamine biosynthesis adenylyltransferase
MTVTFAFAENLWNELGKKLDDACEVAGVMAANVTDGPAGPTVLARTISWAPLEAYVDRSRDGLRLRSDGWVHAVHESLAAGETPVFVHTHPGGKAIFSDRDDHVDDAMRDSVCRMGGELYGSLVLAGTRKDPKPVGRLFERGRTTSASKFRIAGSRLRIVINTPGNYGTTEVFDRQARVFGSAGQDVLAALNVAVVGAGGTGSAAAEQLARLGVGAITIIDDDVVTAATATRGYGITTADLGRSKAEVLAEHLGKTGLNATVTPVTGPVQDAAARCAIASADVVFSCVDGHSARLVLNRWAYAHLAPVIDLAILISAEAGKVTGINGRVTWLSPGAACLLCRARLDPALAYAEMLDATERKRLAGEGYVPDVDTPQPAVITLTSLIASLGTTELLHRLFGLADAEPTEILALIQQRQLSCNQLPQRDQCFCSDPAFLGRGHQPPHLDLAWPT